MLVLALWGRGNVALVFGLSAPFSLGGRGALERIAIAIVVGSPGIFLV
jgi:hypothetical protein